MNSRQRTLRFLEGQPVDRPPFHPILMRWAARYAGVNYRDFCTSFTAKCDAMIRCAEDFDLDWVTVMSDPYCEASAYGLHIDYPENDLPIDRHGHLPSAEAGRNLQSFLTSDHMRTSNRIKEIEEFKRRSQDRFFIVGWVEGPVAEYSDLRGMTPAAMDLLDDPDSVLRTIEVIVESSLDFITQQVNAGADAIGIGDAFCSQIGPDLYRQFAWEGEKRMVDHIHKLGAKAKLHICGNTRSIFPDMIRTGADILDVDHLVTDLTDIAPLLKNNQVFSGNCDPVNIVQNGTAGQIRKSVNACLEQARGRCIVSAGCEITPGTSLENFRVFRACASPS